MEKIKVNRVDVIRTIQENIVAFTDETLEHLYQDIFYTDIEIIDEE